MARVVRKGVISLIEKIIAFEKKRLEDGKYKGYEPIITSILKEAEKVIEDES
jgi:hypothetical protein